MKRAGRMLLIVMLAAAIGALLWLFRDNPEATPPAATAAPLSPSVPVVVATSGPAVITSLPGITVDADGHLGKDSTTRRSVAALLGPEGQPASADIIASAQTTIRANLQEPATSEALQLLDKLAALRHATQQAAQQVIQSNGAAPAADGSNLASAVALQNQSTLRNKYLGTDNTQAIYGDQQAIQRYQLARQQLMQMNGISQEQKDEQLAVLYQQLSPSAQAALRKENPSSNTQ